MQSELKEWLFHLNDLAKDLYSVEWRVSAASCAVQMVCGFSILSIKDTASLAAQNKRSRPSAKRWASPGKECVSLKRRLSGG